MDLLLWSDISFLRRCAFNYGLLIMAYAGGKSVISVCKGALKRANRLILHWAVKRPRNLPGFWWFIQATVLLKVVKREKVFFLGIWKGCQFSREDRKGYLFCEKWYMKGLRGWTPGRRSTVEVLPPPPRALYSVRPEWFINRYMKNINFVGIDSEKFNFT